MTPVVAKIFRLQFASANEAFGRVCVEATQLKSEAGIKRLASEAINYSSTFRTLEDSSKQNAWIQDMFRKHVFPLESLKNVIAHESKTLHIELVGHTNQLLVDLKADVDVDPSTFKFPTVDTKAIDMQIDKLTGGIVADSRRAMEEAWTAAGLGAASGFAGDAIARDIARMDDGEVDFFEGIAAMLIGAATNMAVSNVLNDSWETTQNLERSLSNVADRIIAQCKNGSIQEAIFETYRTTVLNHQVQIIIALSSVYKVDPHWMLDEINAYQAKSASSPK